MYLNHSCANHLSWRWSKSFLIVGFSMELLKYAVILILLLGKHVPLVLNSETVILWQSLIRVKYFLLVIKLVFLLWRGFCPPWTLLLLFTIFARSSSIMLQLSTLSVVILSEFIARIGRCRQVEHMFPSSSNVWKCFGRNSNSSDSLLGNPYVCHNDWWNYEQ